MSPHERFWQILVLLVGVLSLGTGGYQLVEGWSLFDSLYVTVITVASVGFQEVHPLSTAGRSFTIGLIILGLGVVAYGLGTITAFWVEGDLSHLWEKRTMERQIAALQDHIVVCGGGETGQHGRCDLERRAARGASRARAHGRRRAHGLRGPGAARRAHPDPHGGLSGLRFVDRVVGRIAPAFR